MVIIDVAIVVTPAIAAGLVVTWIRRDRWRDQLNRNGKQASAASEVSSCGPIQLRGCRKRRKAACETLIDKSPFLS